jgi:hypothetical protein
MAEIVMNGTPRSAFGGARWSPSVSDEQTASSVDARQ